VYICKVGSISYEVYIRKSGLGSQRQPLTSIKKDGGQPNKHCISVFLFTIWLSSQTEMENFVPMK
jgi:hypothetical protein